MFVVISLWLLVSIILDMYYILRRVQRPSVNMANIVLPVIQ